jgi:glyoxylate/hydroxypyruvate reductase A
MALLCLFHPHLGQGILPRLKEQLPDETLRVWPEVGTRDDLEAALIWRVVPGLFEGRERLSFVSATGAGVDHLLCEPSLPKEVPVTRITDQDFAGMMTDFAIGWIIHIHRDFSHYLDRQKECRWDPLPIRPASACRVGVMGQGMMGASLAARLHAHGFAVAGWARRPRSSFPWPVYAGSAEFDDFLARCDILVNLLPLTRQTVGILNASTFMRLPAGASLIQLGRGAHLDERALLEACDAGQLRHAVIDALSVEPLPPKHPFWTHRSIIVTPHVGSQAPPDAVVRVFAENLQRSRRGAPLINVVDRATGY